MATPLRNFEDILRKMLTVMTSGKQAIGSETITMSAATEYGLTVPAMAKSATVSVEEVGASGTAKVIRYWEDGSIPTSTVGIVKGDADVFDITCRANMLDFKVIRVTAAAHILSVQYYS